MSSFLLSYEKVLQSGCLQLIKNIFYMYSKTSE